MPEEHIYRYFHECESFECNFSHEAEICVITVHSKTEEEAYKKYMLMNKNIQCKICLKDMKLVNFKQYA